MRHLEILLCGHSRVLGHLANELKQMGHSVRLLSIQASFDHWQLHEFDLVIDDATLSEWPEMGLTWQISIRIAEDQVFSPTEDVRVHILRREGSSAWQGLESLTIVGEPSGNGANLANRSYSVIVEAALAHIGGLSRNEDYFNQYGLQPVPDLSRQGMSTLDRLAFEHRHNATAAPSILKAANPSFIQRLADSLSLNAGRPAMLFEGKYLSYAELHALVNAIQERLAPLLRGHGEHPVVAISLQKGFSLYASILAVLGCGAVYLPLDPSHPTERRASILGHAKAQVVLHEGDDLDIIGFEGLRVDYPTLTHNGMNGQSSIALASGQSILRKRCEGHRPCVAIYTSGTTGEPKGVQLSVDNLSHFCTWYADYVEIDSTVRALQFSTISFDASLLDVFPTFIHGGCLVIPNEDQRRDPIALGHLVAQAEVTHGFLPPALLSIMPLTNLQNMVHVVTGGDVCEPHVINGLGAHCALHNIYGPTETTVLATCRRMYPGDSNRLLGRPIANTCLFLLDDQGWPVLEGQVGEIYIGGPGVGLGYLHNPVATAGRYLEAPEGVRIKRLYRTGDLARWAPDGVEIVGRLDNQVKIRGFRVEPEEIEHVLRSSHLFAQLAVVISEQRRVLAFVSEPLQDHEKSALEALKTYAQTHLPDYMRPSGWRLLDTLPRTPNGKVDKKALALMPSEARESLVRRNVLSPVQSSLLTMWAELLEIAPDEIGLDDGFFSLGGHSILLSEMLMKIRDAFGKGVSINRFIELPTLSNLVRLVEQDETRDAVISPQALLDADASVDLDILPLSRMGDLHKVIVTGANGFLGVHMVEALLEQGTTEVACLVRASHGFTAEERFAQALRDNRLDHIDLSRVRILASDISQPLLGLSPQEYERLDREYGSLIYNAANVNHVLDYESLVNENVTPVMHCLKLCEGRSKKIFNFVSTLSACSSVDDKGRVLEGPPASTPPIYIRNGYNISKWVAERILWSASDKGVKVNIYRPGNIAFNTRTGVCQPHQNRLMLMLKGSLQLKEVPQLSLEFDLMPVDFLARFIGFHASRHNIARAVFNLHNPMPLSWDEYVSAFRHSGYEFQMVPVSQWQQRLSTISSGNALYGVVGFYLNGFEEDIGDISMIEYDNAQYGIDMMGECYPAKTSSLLKRGCAFLKEIEFI